MAKADALACPLRPKSDRQPSLGGLTLRAKSGLMHRSKHALLLNRAISFAWLKRMLDKKEGDCKTALAPEKRRKR